MTCTAQVKVLYCMPQACKINGEVMHTILQPKPPLLMKSQSHTNMECSIPCRWCTGDACLLFRFTGVTWSTKSRSRKHEAHVSKHLKGHTPCRKKEVIRGYFADEQQAARTTNEGQSADVRHGCSLGVTWHNSKDHAIVSTPCTFNDIVSSQAGHKQGTEMSEVPCQMPISTKPRTKTSISYHVQGSSHENACVHDDSSQHLHRLPKLLYL